MTGRPVDSLRVVESLSGVDPGEWNALAEACGADAGGVPFVRHEFLDALIESGCATRRTGWLPRILLLYRAGALAGAMPLFLKSHSYGEYVFDWAWADAYGRHGLDYYPKLACAVPFTPVRGPRILASGQRERRALLAAALDLAKESSSLHVLFPLEEEARLMQEHGMLLRRTVQFHWRNDGYPDFEAFLARLSHARRKTIRQERRRVAQAGIACRWLRGAQITRAHWEFFHRCYRNTYAEHRSTPYLNLDFFLRLGTGMPEHTLLVLAERDSRPLAASFFLADRRALYGRYWGAVEHVPLLHFECCYYQAIEFAIAHGLRAFEGGAQGEHKLWRGLLPVETLSAHWLAHPRFARAIEDFLEREGSDIANYVNELREHVPFKSAQGG
ncbi:MAG: GNAT family N-acetyltransferase [Betaproteobacteria bacterium RIFCSPLOWO2_12_FULL_68_20]|nr:MAG: GNAT family N-acetyltransferase [Betaproteobacteria bacterium RIFCSPLOWO2_12_FULL_68_20]